MTPLLVAYVAILALLFLYGAHGYLMAVLRLRARPPSPDPPLEGHPRVTIQLPIYNERYVLPRLVEAMCAMDWPRDRLEIQILDDSTDETRDLAARLARDWSARGVDVRHVTRPDRRGYKAGALAAGLAQARGSLVAVFDADFVPRPDFLRRAVAHLMADPGAACVQARWSHVNEEHSWLTRAQAVGIDGHFSVEQRARNDHALPLNFNGTAGLWRVDAIRDAGGWTADTLAEDLDLSYRAQLQGWRLLYLEDLDAPAEIPAQIHAFKRQQARWARGSIQCFRKHARAVVASRALRPAAKLEALLHLSHYVVHPLMLALSLILLPLVLTTRIPFPLAGLLFGATFGPPAMYAVGQRVRHPTTWVRRLRRLFPLTVLGIGVAVSNTRAVVEGLARSGGEFRRTPKHRIERAGDTWRGKQYGLGIDWSVYAEALMALWMAATVVAAVATGNLGAVPWALLFLVAYGAVAVTGLAHRVARAGGTGVSAPAAAR